MITCINTIKVYDKKTIINQFSYTFADTGFYLLLGESGSGKTTFINILSGMIPFDGGAVKINGAIFFERVDMDMAGISYDYITQDAFFVDFLTVYDNLRLICDDKIKIVDILARFGLSDKADIYPDALSGGERQRAAIARSMLSSKKILFLDEPTASLDEKSKRDIFALLSDISKSCLVICASHDIEALTYADDVIEFTKDTVPSYPITTDTRDRAKESKWSRDQKSMRSTRELRPYLKKWFSSKKRSHRADILFGVFLTIAMCFLMLADTPQHKIDINADSLYQINTLSVANVRGGIREYEYFTALKGIKDVIPVYGTLLPDYGDKYYNPEAGTFETPATDYETSLQIIPFESSTFRMSDHIAYGTYFTDKYQVILSYERARFLSPNNLQNLIGQKITKNIYGIGEVELEIVGIFMPFNDIERQYFYSAGMTLPNDKDIDWDNINTDTDMFKTDVYVNSELTKDYVLNPDYFDDQDSRSYILYFDSYYDMKEAYLSNEKYFFDNRIGAIPFFEDEFIIDTYRILSIIFLPLALFVIVLSILLYTYLAKTEITYNNRFVSVFNYAGYSLKQIVNTFVGLNLKRLFCICAVSGFTAFCIANIVNFANSKLYFINIQIFTYNITLVLGATALIILSSIAAVNLFLRRFRYYSWYENLIEQRDLL